jgi:uncharacterized repeat protein (TIGR02543 family)
MWLKIFQLGQRGRRIEMETRRFLTSFVASFFTVIFLLAFVPSAFSEEEMQSYIPFTSAILTSADETTKKIVLESYLTNQGDEEETIKPCDIIFVLDQSKWMNTVEDAGEQRRAIITELQELLNDLAEPTTGGEHRVAIAGYGRLNMSASTDPYNAQTYPGTKATGNNISLNTGYYTTEGFVSQNGWSDISQSEMSGSGLPKMAASYQAAMTYDRAFMTLEEAETVLNEDTMLAWYAGASRMDAGLTIAEQLATIANEHDTDEDRNLIVCILSSSLPIQNTVASNKSTIRTEAVLTASEQLKSQGATIFAFGDYHASGKSMSGTVQDTEETFTSIMQQVCTKASYFYSFSDFSSVTEALNQMITQIVITVAESAEQNYTVQSDEFIVVDGEEESVLTWQDVLDYYGFSAENVINNTVTTIEYYYFAGYDSLGNPTFEEDSYIRIDLPLNELVTGDGLAYSAVLIPLPVSNSEIQNSETNSYYGNKVVITISAPVTVRYQWAGTQEGYAPSNAQIPDAETVALGTTHEAASVKYADETYDVHYEFDGWYTDSDCLTPYSGTDALYADIILYGKWSQYVVIEYYWNFLETGYLTPDGEDRVKNGEIPNDYIPDGLSGYTFDGWYYSQEFTDSYVSSALTEDIQLYAKWIPKTDTSYQIRYYQQNVSDDEYTEAVDQAEALVGTTGEGVTLHNPEYEGFTLSHITYEDNNHFAQSDAMTISGDGSLLIKVYYNRNTYQVHYDGNGADDGVLPVDDTSYRYAATVCVAQDTVQRGKYSFVGWNTAEDGSGIGYLPEESFSITEDTVLYAQWVHLTWTLSLVKQGEEGELLEGARFAIYTCDPDLILPEEEEKLNGYEIQRQVTLDDTVWYLLDVCTTDENGKIQWDGLIGDSYYLLEVEAPNGYTLGRKTGQIVSALFGGVQEVTITNAKALIVPQTGISNMNLFPYALLTGIAVALLVGCLVIKYKKYKKNRQDKQDR